MKVRNTIHKFGAVVCASAVIGATTVGQAYADAAAAATKITGSEADVETIGYAALGPDGYLAERGLTALADDLRKKVTDDVTNAVKVTN